MQRASEARARISAAESRVHEAERRAGDALVKARTKVAGELRVAMLRIAHLERQIAGREYVEIKIHQGMEHR